MTAHVETEGAGGGEEAVARTFREEWGRVVATLARAFGDLDVAEDATQDAFAIAVQVWPSRGVPSNPGAWLTTTARRRAIDRLRRDAQRGDKEARGVSAADGSGAVGDAALEPVDDDLLRLVFTCCHPAIEPQAQVALTLRLVGGLTTAEIARAFLVPEATLAQRLVRAKAKVRAAGIPLRMPDDEERPQRLASVLAVVQLVFNEGYVATAGDGLDRADLCADALHLGRLLVGLVPDEPEVRGLLALMVLVAARRPARVTADGALVPLPEQDRGRWDRALVAEGQAIVRDCLREGRPGPFQLHAAINAVHSDAPDHERTDWAQIVALYDQLMAVAPTPVVALNRAVAVAEVAGPAVALELVEQLPLDRYHLWHATRAELLERCGDTAGSVEALRQALSRTDNPGERRLLERRLRQRQP